jgi:hypothetical protein
MERSAAYVSDLERGNRNWSMNLVLEYENTMHEAPAPPWCKSCAARLRQCSGRSRCSGSPQWKVYTQEGEYVAAMKYPSDAAMVIAGLGGGTVRHQHRRVVWDEATALFPAGESYDRAAEVMLARLNGVEA